MFHLYREWFSAIAWNDSDQVRNYKHTTSSIPELERQGILEKFFSLFQKDNQGKTPEEIDEESLQKLVTEAKEAVDEALKRNTYNLRTDVLDVIPISILETRSPLLIGIWIIAFAISIHGTVREFRHRKNSLLPKMQKAREKYSEVTWIEVEEQIRGTVEKVFWRFGLWWIIKNKDVSVDVLESIIEIISILWPGMLIPGILSPLLEIPLDAASRNQYYKYGKELSDMQKEIDTQKKSSE